MTGIQEYPAPRYNRADYKATKKRFRRYLKQMKHAKMEHLMKNPPKELLQPQKLEETQHA